MASKFLAPHTKMTEKIIRISLGIKKGFWKWDLWEKALDAIFVKSSNHEVYEMQRSVKESKKKRGRSHRDFGTKSCCSFSAHKYLCFWSPFSLSRNYSIRPIQ